jgi:di/tricarboxylate transporter
MLERYGLDLHGVAVLFLAAAMFLALALDRWPIETVSLVVLVALPVFFLLFPYRAGGHEVSPFDFFFGFGHEALIAISALMIVGQSLLVTGALEPVGRLAGRVFEKRPRVALALVLLFALAASGLVNDTPIVLVLIPLLTMASRRSSLPASTLLMPMNFAVLIGGMATTIGTSTNLIVVATAADLGLPRIGLFDFYPLVAAAAVPALLYLWLLAPRLLAHVPQPPAEHDAAVFEAQLHIGDDSKAAGQTLGELLERAGERPKVREIRRADGLSIVPLASATLKAGDRLLVRGTVERLKEFASVAGAELHGVHEEKREQRTEDAPEGGRKAKEPGQGGPTIPENDVLAQLIVGEDSLLAHSTVRRARLASLHDVMMVGLRRGAGGEWGRKDLTEAVLQPGDVLLLQGTQDALRRVQSEGLGLLLDRMSAVARADKAPIALGVLLAIVVTAATKLLPIALAALAGVAVLVLTRSIGWREASSALSRKVVLLVASSLALGHALLLTGAIQFMADRMLAVAGDIGPHWMLALLMVTMGAITNFVSNNAAAAIGTPLAIALAGQLGVPPEPFVLAVLFGCNLCYVTPMGYQTNLLVMKAGGYRFGDFVRVGAPLFVIMATALTALLWIVYPL